MIKRHLTAALGFIALIATATGTARAADPFELNVILPMTGPAAFLGKSEATTLPVIESLVNASGGIRGRPVKFTILDDQSNPQVDVQLANHLIAKKVPVFLGPSVAAMCGAISSLVLHAGPVAYCYSPAIHPPAGSYQFSASVNTYDLAANAMRYFRLRGWTNVALITSTDATGQDFDRQTDAVLALPENRPMKLVAHEHFNPSDVTVMAQVSNVLAAKPQAMIVWTTGTPLSVVLHGLHDAGADFPVLTSSSNMSPDQLDQMASFLPKDLLFPGLTSTTFDPSLPTPIRNAQTKFFAAFKDAGVRTQFGNGIIFDATMIVVDALRKLGPDASAEQIRDYIAKLHDWPGINGIYDFRDGSQRGIGQLGALIHRWDSAKRDFVPISKPGGYLR